ncbi:FAD-binding protein [Paracrocinitomix mangrovi]|uniref:FAD-binding oxidoreductase n=1 Tax=Paracrocinitomix mangrovi TaxID=2862509 RepID=UPI001C8D9E6C|nr:FAD-linked oxidase C-terminal domain-containing protein [Paracrocinitomix mangrovi]UKN02540.1 FAD-binding protein [Paracrocinitomix mangrovi]
MSYKKVDQQDIKYFTDLLSSQNIKLDAEQIAQYAHDETEDLVFSPDIVLVPQNTVHLAAILKYCNEQTIAVTPQGSRTGLSGGALPLFGGVALSLEKFNKILQIDEKNGQVTVEPAVITQVLQEAVAEKGLFYPPDPASKGSCSIGGNLAENSGGPKAVKYGVTNEYVLNLEVVLANGDIIWTGANVLKNATGYNLTQLVVGSEGTLAVITKAVLKLIPHPQKNMLMLVPFKSAEEACEAVAAIFRKGLTPSGMEFMERDALLWTKDFIGDDSIVIQDDIQAHLLIEVDGNVEEVLMNECEQIMEVVEAFDVGEILFADSQAQKDKLWNLRRKVGEAVKSQSIYKEEDTVVPRYELPKLLKGVKDIGNQYGFHSVCYGHAGDGNLHINIIKGDMSDDKWDNELSTAIREIFELTVSLGGTISGEHGIGHVQKNYMDIPFGKTELNLMKGIKDVFDPKGILNPGKIFPD